MRVAKFNDKASQAVAVYKNKQVAKQKLRILKVYHYNDTGIWWTLPIESNCSGTVKIYCCVTNFTLVGDVCQTICDKLGGESVIGYFLVIKTKRTIGRPKGMLVIVRKVSLTDIQQ